MTESSGAARLYDRLLKALALLAGLYLLFIVLLTTYDITVRNLGIDGIPWLVEAVEYGLFAATFLAAPWVLRLGGHVRVDILVARLPEQAAKRTNRLVAGAGLVVSLVLLVHGARATWAAYEAGALVFKYLIFPEWWILIVLPISGGLLAIEFARRLAGHDGTEFQSGAGL
jgi:TRAP-type C4-dicarboxylate transport system permease small subunit